MRWDRKNLNKGKIEFINVDEWGVRILRRNHQRNCNLHVYPNGNIVVTCNRSLGRKSIYNFLKQSEVWIKERKSHFESAYAHFQSPYFYNGMEIPWQGKNLPVYFTKSRTTEFYKDSTKIVISSASPPQKQSQFKQLLKRFYKNQANTIFNEHVRRRSQELGLFPKKVITRYQKTLWGSCSSENVISLNWKLLMASVEALDSVIVHELCHIKHKNHSRNFWNLVESYVPEHKMHSMCLKKQQYEFDFLSDLPELFTSKVSF